MSVLEQLWTAGHAAYLVGGGVRDQLLGRPVIDWDVATDAQPERIKSLFADGRYENKFGTVTVPSGDLEVQVTTFRRDHLYADHRRPSSVSFSESLNEDLARRDFTVNAIAWGRAADGAAPVLVDMHGGMDDLNRHVLRAVGEPAVRFDEDALRLLRAARLAAQLDFEIEPLTRAAMGATAESIQWVSNERVGEELRRMLSTTLPSRGFSIMAQTGVLARALPELDAQRGVAQDKAPGMDLWAHCLATLDAAATIDPGNATLGMAALLHDIGKPTTFSDGHFIGHDSEGARLAEVLLARLAFGHREVELIVGLIANHMFSYETRWTSAAVRRFIRRVGRDQVDDLLNLRAADNMGSGLPANAGKLDELRARVARELAAGVPLSLRELAVNGDDLLAELAVRPGPQVGQLLEWLLGLVIAEPDRNERSVLLGQARDWLARQS